MIRRCSRCTKDAIHFQAYSGLHLCREHFTQDLERKAKREIRRNHWLRHGDRIGILRSEGRRSAALLHLLQTITRGRRDITIVTLSSDTKQYSSGAIPVDELIPPEDPNRPTAIALCTTLDDDAVSILTSFLSGDISSILHPDADREEKIRRITPLATIPSGEVDLYADLLMIDSDEEIHPESDIRAILSGYTDRHPSTLYAVAHIGEAIRRANRKHQRITATND
jgi:tRNA(Ile)-lysidine synthase TilS/MesJ